MVIDVVPGVTVAVGRLVVIDLVPGVTLLLEGEWWHGGRLVCTQCT